MTNTEHDYLQQLQGYQARKMWVWDKLLIIALVLAIGLLVLALVRVGAERLTDIQLVIPDTGHDTQFIVQNTGFSVDRCQPGYVLEILQQAAGHIDRSTTIFSVPSVYRLPAVVLQEEADRIERKDALYDRIQAVLSACVQRKE